MVCTQKLKKAPTSDEERTKRDKRYESFINPRTKNLVESFIARFPGFSALIFPC